MLIVATRHLENSFLNAMNNNNWFWVLSSPVNQAKQNPRVSNNRVVLCVAVTFPNP